MVRPVSLKGFQKGFQGVSLRGFRGFQIFLWELCVCIKYLSLGDPCMGSGHILVYMFDVLMQIYLSYGYTTNEAVESIVRNNLWGMDIDDRAAQLAYFAVMMKAQQYDHRWLAKQLRRPVQPNVFALQDSGDWPTFERQMRQAFTHHPSLMEEASIKTAKALFETFADAKEYGSIIQPEISLEELNMLENTLDEMAQKADLMDFVAQADAATLMETLKPLIMQCRGLVQKYHAVVTNPPYMGSGGMNSNLSNYVKEHYFESKADLFAVFIEKGQDMLNKSGFLAMITQHSWMFLPSFSKMRDNILNNSNISSLLHLGTRAFDGNDVGTIVQTCAFVLGGFNKGQYLRLVEINDADEKREAVLNHAVKVNDGVYYSVSTSEFKKVPGHPIAYWVSDRFASIFEKENIGKYAISDGQTKTGDNDRYLRNLWEVDATKVGGKGYKWVKHVKGGSFRKWYGNLDTLIDWSDAARKHYKTDHVARITPEYLWFRTGFSWTLISEHFSIRVLPNDCTFNLAAPSLFFDDENSIYPVMGYLNSIIAYKSIKIFNPTFNTNIGDICVQPADYLLMPIKETISEIVKNAIEISKRDWDSFETSWDFQQHPLVRHKPAGLHEMRVYGVPVSGFEAGREIHAGTIEQAFMAWQHEADERFVQLKANEEELNRIFIDIYGLQDELTPEVDDKDVTVRKADLGRDIRSLISYAVGCMLGRYSLDKPGLAFAGGTWDESQYVTYHADHDGILPITDDEYFDDDIVGMFIGWVRTVYGAETLEANLKFIADALGGKGNPREVIRQYFLNDFYKDHLKTYQKRPIYWLFDSGKKNGFKCLIYMHRYQPDTIARIRTDYLHETQARYRNAIETLERQSANASTGERVKMTKRLNALKAQAEEARVYEEKIHHLADQMIKIDLDDGVKVNYAKFADVLAAIK